MQTFLEQLLAIRYTDPSDSSPSIDIRGGLIWKGAKFVYGIKIIIIIIHLIVVGVIAIMIIINPCRLAFFQRRDLKFEDAKRFS